MTTSRQDPPTPGTEHPHGRTPTIAEVEEMSLEQRARLAAELDDVEIVHNQPKFPIPGTRAEKRAERSVAKWFAISAVAGAAFFAAFIWWPYQYRAPGDPGYSMYTLYTPVIGATFGIAVLALGIAVIAYVKKIFPHEVAVQQRHDGPSDDVSRLTVLAQLTKAGQDTGIGEAQADHPCGGCRGRPLRPRAHRRRDRPAGHATRGRTAPTPRCG